MRASRLHLVTYREDPADAEVRSHKLMTRAGLIFKVSSGLYAYSPLLWRSLKKAQDIVREELDATGCLELQLPILQDESLWQQSGRWDLYRASGTMFTATDRKQVCYGLAPTAEEVVTAYVRQTVKSYKQLPLCLYQIHTKFRDELRPRFGLLRVKEFLMKDAYSFDSDEEGLDRSYEAMRVAYHRIFARMGLDSFGVDADPGDIGGSGSMEFMVAAETGEDAILIDETSGYAANVEKASSRFSPPVRENEEERALRIENTPGVRSCQELNRFFEDVPEAAMVKTVLFAAVHTDEEVLWAALIRGDQEINEVKLRNHTGGLALRMLSPEEILQHTGAEHGFAGPIDLSEGFSVIADHSVEGMKNLLCGVNQTDKHALDVNIGRDFKTPHFADFRLAREGEPALESGEPLRLARGIEVGHIFKLGTKYSAAMEATCMDPGGRERPLVMGCYGIGVSRVVAAAVEQKADEHGIVWPAALAPFPVVLACLTPKKAEIFEASERLYEELLDQGHEILFDDRKLSPGAKMKDLELIGFPYVLLIGRSFAQDGVIEAKVRASMKTEHIKPSEVSAWIETKLREEAESITARG